MTLSRTQVNQLGDRLRAGPFTDSDRELLLEYRASFLPVYRQVVEAIRERLGIDPTGRPEKTPESIVAKLIRTKIELARMQDIAGCRLTVTDISAQDRVLVQLVELFPSARVTDRRVNPSFGYRAVHVIASLDGKTVEIQVRTFLQNFWASISERAADQYGIELKYGGAPPGAEVARHVLDWAASAIAVIESEEREDPEVYGLSDSELRMFKIGQATAIMQLALQQEKIK